ncbi:HMA2 domain-containing protein [Wukongibacter baidiensis]
MRIISSIPGRIRVNVNGLLRNERLGYGILKSLKELEKVNSVSFNVSTGNVLIYYKYQYKDISDILYRIQTFTYKDTSNYIPRYITNDSPTKILIRTLNPFNLLTKKFPVNIFEQEYSLSRRIIKMGIFMGGIVLAINPHIRTLASIMILTYPGILFTISSMSHFYSARKAFLNEVYVKNSNSIGQVAKTNAFFIEDKVLIGKENAARKILDKNQEKMTIEKLSAIGKVTNLTNPEIRSFIEETRKYGVTDLTVFSDKKDDISKYIAYALGIDKVHLVKDKIFILNDLKNQENIMLFIHESLVDKIRNIDLNLTVCVYSDLNNSVDKGSINVIDRNIKRIPWLLKLSKNNEELITRFHASSISVNTLAIYAAVLLRINPLITLSIYMVNLLAHINILRNSIFKEENKNISLFRHSLRGVSVR